MPVERVITSEKETELGKTAKLGKAILLPPITEVSINEKPVTIAYSVPTVEISIGIGNDHDATLIMSKEAWKALQRVNKLEITLIETE